MNAAWQDYLRGLGAEIDAETVRFDESAALAAAGAGNLLADLSPLGLIRASGADAREFLQNQFSSDVREVGAQHSQISSYCTAKGRVLAVFRILQEGDAFLLVLPRSILENTLGRLRMFVLRSQVELADVSDEYVVAGLAGEAAPALVAEAAGAAPSDTDEVVETEGARLVRLHGATPRFLVVATPAAMPTLWTRWQASATPGGETAWRLLAIRAGEPAIAPQTVEHFVPQMMNLDVLGGISFRKGCYPGQEIVARTHYRGKLKRRMFPARCDSAEAIAPGTEIYVAGGQQAIGEVVQAAPSPDGGQELLAVLRLENRDDKLCLGGPEGAPLAVGDPPGDLQLDD